MTVDPELFRAIELQDLTMPGGWSVSSGQVHLYTPEANQLREQIDRYVEAERQIEGEMARRRIRA